MNGENGTSTEGCGTHLPMCCETHNGEVGAPSQEIVIRRNVCADRSHIIAANLCDGIGSRKRLIPSHQEHSTIVKVRLVPMRVKHFESRGRAARMEGLGGLMATES